LCDPKLMKYAFHAALIVMVFALAPRCARGGLISLVPSTPTELLKSDQIICVDARNLTQGTTKDAGGVWIGPFDPISVLVATSPKVLRGPPSDRVSFYATVPTYPTYPPDSRYLLIFLKKSADGSLRTIAWASILGFDQDMPDFDGSFSSEDRFFDLLQRMFFKEQSLACAMQQAVVLANAPASSLSRIPGSMIAYANDDSQPLKACAALAILLQTDGFKAMREIKVPDVEKLVSWTMDDRRKNGLPSSYAARLSGPIDQWITHHIDAATYRDATAFARTQSSRLRSTTLISARNFAMPENLDDVVQIFQSDSGKDVKYGCVQNFWHAFGEPIHGIDAFNKHQREITAHWSKWILETPSAVKKLSLIPPSEGAVATDKWRNPEILLDARLPDYRKNPVVRLRSEPAVTINGHPPLIPLESVLAELAALPASSWPDGRIILLNAYPGLERYPRDKKEYLDRLQTILRSANIEICMLPPA